MLDSLVALLGERLTDPFAYNTSGCFLKLTHDFFPNVYKAISTPGVDMYEPPTPKSREDAAAEDAAIAAYARKKAKERIYDSVACWNSNPREEIEDSMLVKAILAPDEDLSSLMEDISEKLNITLTKEDLEEMGITTQQKKFLCLFPYTIRAVPEDLTLGRFTEAYVSKIR